MKLSATHSYVTLTFLQFLAVQAVAVPTCSNLSGAGCSVPAVQEMFTDLAQKGWAVYFVAQPPDSTPTPDSSAVSSSLGIAAGNLPLASSYSGIPTASQDSIFSSSSLISSSSATPDPSLAVTSSPPSISSTASPGTMPAGPKLKILGIILAVASGLLIGSSFVFKKKGLLRSQAAGTAGEGVKYLKSPLWWLGMSMMILGELCNFAAYAFVEAIVVTPLGALSVVVCAILSAIFLKERLNLLGWLGCGLCILGATVIALNAPQEDTVGQILDFQKLFVSIIFLVYVGIILVASLLIIFVLAPRYGKINMLWYILVCSMIGGISVSVTTGLGAAIVTTVGGDNQFKNWFIYVLIVVVLGTLVVEVYYLNVALALFNTAIVTPTYYVIFTFFSIVTTLVLFRGLSASIPEIMTLVLAFLVICIGIVLLQISKSTPHDVGKSELARHSTFLVWSPSEVSEEKTVRSSPPKSEHQIPNPDPADARDILINAPRGSLGLTLAGIIQAWRHGVDSDFDESSDAHEVDLGNRGMLHNDDKYESDSESLRFSEATWRRLVPGETRRRVSITAR